MSENDGTKSEPQQRTRLSDWINHLKQRENQLLIVLALVIGALTGASVVAFILLTERVGLRLFPVGSGVWRRVVIPILGSLGMGYLLFRYFPEARGSGVPQTKAALFAREGVITARTALGKFFCTAATLASGIPWDVKAHLCRWVVGLLRCWAARLAFVLKRCRP